MTLVEGVHPVMGNLPCRRVPLPSILRNDDDGNPFNIFWSNLFDQRSQIPLSSLANKQTRHLHLISFQSTLYTTPLIDLGMSLFDYLTTRKGDRHIQYMILNRDAGLVEREEQLGSGQKSRAQCLASLWSGNTDAEKDVWVFRVKEHSGSILDIALIDTDSPMTEEYDVWYESNQVGLLSLPVFLNPLFEENISTPLPKEVFLHHLDETLLHLKPSSKIHITRHQIDATRHLMLMIMGQDPGDALVQAFDEVI